MSDEAVGIATGKRGNCRRRTHVTSSRPAILRLWTEWLRRHRRRKGRVPIPPCTCRTNEPPSRAPRSWAFRARHGRRVHPAMVAACRLLRNVHDQRCFHAILYGIPRRLHRDVWLESWRSLDRLCGVAIRQRGDIASCRCVGRSTGTTTPRPDRRDVIGAWPHFQFHVHALWQVVLLYGIIMTLGANCLGLVLVVPMLSRHFVENRGIVCIAASWTKRPQVTKYPAMRSRPH